MVNLRDYQEKAKDKIIEFLNDPLFQKGLIVHPVALGKSILTGVIADNTEGHILIIQPNKELLEQNYAKAKLFGIEATKFSASVGEKIASKVTYATPMSVVKHPDLFRDVEVVCIDEAHMGMGIAFQGRKKNLSKITEFLYKIKPRKVIGLTATPIITTSDIMGSKMEFITRTSKSYWKGAEIIDLIQVGDIYDKYWADIELINKPEDTSFLSVNSSGTDFTEKSVVSNYQINHTGDKVIDEINAALERGRKHILVFVPSVEDAKELESKHPEVKALYGDLPKKERDTLVNDFKSGRIKVVANVLVASTGFDFPALETLIMARETRSFNLFYQVYGRLVRPLVGPNGEVNRVKKEFIDLTSNTLRFGNVKGISYEEQVYTGGWALFCGDTVLTGFSLNQETFPTRQDFIKIYNKKQNTLLNVPKESGELETVNIKVGTKHTITCVPDDAKNITLTFGKYKGQRLSRVWEKDKGYLEWLMKNMTNLYAKSMYHLIYTILALKNNKRYVVKYGR